MISIQQYLEQGNYNEDYDDGDYFEEQEQPEYCLSSDDHTLYNKYRACYQQLIDCVDQINEIASNDCCLDSNPQAIQAGQRCAQLIGEMGDLASAFQDDQLGEFLFDILCVADYLYDGYPQPSNFADGGEFYTTTIENLDYTIMRYEYTGEFDQFVQ